MKRRGCLWTRIVTVFGLFGAALSSQAAECSKEAIARRFGNVSFDHEAAAKAAPGAGVVIRNLSQPFDPLLCAAVVRALDRIGPGTTSKLRYFFVQSLSLNGSPISGLFRSTDLVLVAYYPHDRYDVAQWARTIYHETSSYVYHQYPELVAEWEALHDQQMVAGRCAFHSPQWYFWHPDEGHSRSERYRNCGVLIGYGASDAENDFNTYAEEYYTDLAGLRRLARGNGAIAKKLFLFEKFYPTGD